MSYLTVETRELEDLRRKHSVACGLVAEQTSTIAQQTRQIGMLEEELRYLRRMLKMAIENKVSAGGTAA